MADKSGFKRILQGSMLVLIGTGIDMGLAFSTRIVSARLLPPVEYGKLIFGITFLNMTALVANLGLQDGIARNISGESRKNMVFISGLISAIISSIVMAAVLFVASEPLADYFFGQDYKEIIIIFSLTIPFQVLLWVVISGFRGLGITRFPIIFENISQRLLIFIFAFLGILISHEATGAAVGWFSGVAITSITGIAVLFKETSLISNLSLSASNIQKYASSIVLFSVPLMLANSSWRLVQELDNIFIASILGGEPLGKYDASFTIGRIMLIMFWAFSFLFLPLFTNYYENEEYNQMQTFYTRTTKWITALVFPAYLIVITFPELILSTTFGDVYSDASLALVILASGFIIHASFGLNKTALTAIGNTKAVFIFTFISLALNTILNLLLIPIWGIAGAAVASLLSYFCLNVISSYKLWKEYQIKPHTSDMIGFLMISLILFYFLYETIVPIFEISFYTVASFGITFYILHLVLFVIYLIHKGNSGYRIDSLFK